MKNATRFSRRGLLQAAGLGLAASLRAAAVPVDRPNILFIFTDDQRHDTIAALGNKDIQTPNLDKLVRSGTTFGRAYIAGSDRGAVCMPSRAMLLTGRHYMRLGDISLNPGSAEGPFSMFPNWFRQAGYETFGTGKWHQSRTAYAACFSDGGNIFFGGMGDHFRLPLLDFAPDGNYMSGAEYKEYTEKRLAGPEDIHAAEAFTNAAIGFLERRDPKRPFLMYVSYTAPHDPRVTPKEFHEHYDPEKMPLPGNFMPMHPFDTGVLMGRDEQLAPHPRTPEVVRRHIADYYAMITHADHHIGRLLQALEDSGAYDNTLIVFSGDNGLALGQHGLFGKQNLYEHSIHVPLILSGPGIPKYARRNVPCYLLDLFPTLCDYVQLPIPESVEGKSLIPHLRDPYLPGRETLSFAHQSFSRGVSDGRYKLTEYAVDGVRHTQLFDIKSDPLEMNNLAGKQQYAEHLAELRKALLDWKAANGDEDAAYWDTYFNAPSNA